MGINYVGLGMCVTDQKDVPARKGESGDCGDLYEKSWKAKNDLGEGIFLFYIRNAMKLFSKIGRGS